MPELPEITAHAERLADNWLGAELTAFRPLHLTALKTYAPRPDDAYGRALTGTGHRGKYLYLHFDDLTFVIHLMQGGRLRPDPKQAKKPRGGMARWVFADGGALLLTEAGTEHKAGVWLVAGDPEGQEPVDHLGPDATSMSRDDLAAALASENTRVHGFLRDQRRIAGIGRLLSNEILWTAKLSPFAMTKKLPADDIHRLHDAMQSVIRHHIEFERTLDDIGKSADRPSAVHHRIGFPCQDCDDEVRSVEYRRYTVAYCPTCQTGGKELADNTTSKFLK
ncbi:MAG: DNA-formamidopyrimidine glycosylase family protein [Acidimicrobiales bacterium]|nr:DNA-formamidopyrimidine glycosylase family protein [Acidimicrobiales bacterium]